MKSKGIVLQIGPFIVRLDTSLNSVIESVKLLYSDYTFLAESPELFSDFYIRIDRPSFYRGYCRSQVQCYIDGKTPFKPLPLDQAFPFFEWGLNWVIASHIHYYLLVHAAVVEKDGHVLILCGKPGAGKSTLCAALVCRGWRLFSDEMAVIDLVSNELIPCVRPVSLKNKAIDIISEFSPDSVFGVSYKDTAKGTLSHMKPNKDSVEKGDVRAFAKWVVFPQYKAGSETSLKKIPKGQTVIELAKNSFNYNLLGIQGFNSLCDLVEDSHCYEFEYSDLNEAISLFDGLPA